MGKLWFLSSYKMPQKWQYLQCSDQNCIPLGCLACSKGLSLNTIQQVCSPQFLMLISLMFKQRHNRPHWDSASSNAVFCMHKNMPEKGSWETFETLLGRYFLLIIVNNENVRYLCVKFEVFEYLQLTTWQCRKEQKILASTNLNSTKDRFLQWISGVDIIRAGSPFSTLQRVHKSFTNNSKSSPKMSINMTNCYLRRQIRLLNRRVKVKGPFNIL